MYCIAEGTTAETLEAVHGHMLDLARGVVTLPGDGDTTLRALQWRHPYQFTRKFAWLNSLVVPVECLYSSNAEQPVFPMQDMLHNIKKGRNNIKRLETRCLVLGLDINRYS